MASIYAGPAFAADPPEGSAEADATVVTSSQIDVTGVILDVDGSPAAAASVNVYAWPIGFGEETDAFSLIEVGSGTADAEGEFSITPDYTPLWADVDASGANRPQTIDLEIVAQTANGTSSYSVSVDANPTSGELVAEVSEATQQNIPSATEAATTQDVVERADVTGLVTGAETGDTLELALQVLPVEEGTATGSDAETVGPSLGLLNPSGAIAATLASTVTEPTPEPTPEPDPDGSGDDTEPTPPPLQTCGSKSGCEVLQPDAQNCEVSRNLGPLWTVVGGFGATTTGYSGRLTYNRAASTTVTAGVSTSGRYGTFSVSGTMTRDANAAIGFPSRSSANFNLERTQFTYAIFRCYAHGDTRNTRYVTRMTGFAGGSSSVTASTPAAGYCTPYNAGSSFTLNRTSARNYDAAVAGMYSVLGLQLSARTGYSSTTSVAITFSSNRNLCGAGAYPGSGTPGVVVVKPR